MASIGEKLQGLVIIRREPHPSVFALEVGGVIVLDITHVREIRLTLSRSIAISHM